jgi:uncharacterized membrane protein YgcG
MIDDTQYVWLEYTDFSVIVAFINDLIGVFFLRLMPKKVNRKKLTNQKLMIAIAMIALLTAIGSTMSIGSIMNKNTFVAFARSSSSSDDSNTDDQQGSGDSGGSGSSDNGNDNGGSSGSGSSDSGGGLSHKEKLHNQLEKSGLCPPDHECSCTPASGVFHDHTTGFNINTGCTSDKG